MDYLITFEIWQIILDVSDFLTQIRLTQVCIDLNQCLRITDFYNIDNCYLQKLNDNILKNYPYITQLNADSNINVTNVNHLSRLKKLNAEYICGINDEGIKDLNLYELDASNNRKITNVNHMNNLKILQIYGDSGINNNGLRYINLIELNIGENDNIKDISHMTNLKILDASHCNIRNKHIKSLDLIQLSIVGSKFITKINHMKNLKILLAFDTSCCMDNAGLQGLNLFELYAESNSKITKEGIKHMTNLIKTDVVI